MTRPPGRPEPDPRTLAFFLFFLASGACGLVYQVVWLRLAMAGFGVTAPLTSIVLSVFMGGLALGSWAAGRLAQRWRGSPAVPVRLYALAEVTIAVSATVVPWWLERGRLLLAGSGTDWGSLAHYLAAGAWVALGLLPFCTAMGMTFPLAIWALRRGSTGGSFGFLYVANVTGACLGTLASAFVLIEVLGFRGTLAATAALNATVAAGALLLSLRPVPGDEAATGPAAAAAAGGSEPWTRALLFATGFSSMGMEVVWVRQYTPYLGTEVYAFAAILATYLTATSLGTALYRWRERRRPGFPLSPDLLAWLGVLGLLPLLAADPRLPLHPAWGAIRLAAGLVPLSFALGFLTPLLVDRHARDDAGRAGAAYAVNIVGCILGPLAAGFLLLPLLGDRGALLCLAAPLLALAALRLGPPARARLLPALAAAAVLVLLTRDFTTLFPQRRVLRDHTATVTAVGAGMGRMLLVNGVGMTALTSDTKMMGHLPAAFRPRPPRRSLVICFGMGTSFRALHAWGAPTTAVELIPSVPRLFSYFHDDAESLLRSPRARIVVDDGRRFLERDRELYDVITIDPPPPFAAAGSSLLYSMEFLALVRGRLAPGGVLQHWLPEAEVTGAASAVRALVESFPHLRAFRSREGWGTHFLASEQPLESLSAQELAARLPGEATRDLLEWTPGETVEEQFAAVLAGERPPLAWVALAPTTPPLRDDRPVNEYSFLRRTRARLAGR